MSTHRSSTPFKPKTREYDEKSKKDFINENPLKPIITVEETFDLLMEQIQTLPLNQTIENLLKNLFESEKVILWIYFPEEGVLFSPTLSRSVPIDSGVVSHCFNTKIVTLIESLSSHQSFSPTFDSISIPENSSVILLPLMNKVELIKGIVQISRTNGFFNEIHQNFASYLSNKFKTYSKFIFENDKLLQAAQSIITIDTLPKSVLKVSQSLIKYFRSIKIEFYFKKLKENIYYKIDDINENPISIDKNLIGIVKTSLDENIIINEKKIKNNKLFDSKFDGDGDSAFLSIPYISDENRIWSIVFKGRSSPPFYSKTDESFLIAIIPFAIKSIFTSLQPPSDLPQLDFQHRLTVLLDVAETLSGVLDIETLIPTIMERACQILHADRCSLFLVDKGKHELVTQFHGGLSKAIRLPMARGIVGHTAITGKVVNIRDAYEDPRFDRTVDQSTGFRTISLLTVPIYNNRGEITGVTEMINKANGESFTDDDIRMMMAFNVFCGTSLDNAKLYKASLDLSHQLRTFTEMSNALIKTKTIEAICEDILENARSIVSANRASLFIYDNNDRSLKLFAHVGIESKFGSILAQESVLSRSLKLFEQDDIAKLTQTIQLESAIEKLMGDTSLIENLSSTSSKKSIIFSTDKTQETLKSKEMVCCIPIMDSSAAILGIMELSCNWKIVDEDLKLLDCFSVFASVAIERNNLKDIAEHGQVEFDLKNWLKDEERNSITNIPKKLKLIPELLEPIFTINFDAPSYDGMAHFKVIFHIFEYFGFCKDFNITNEKLFRFLSSVRDYYKKVPYHNWRHAVDVTQFITYELIVSGMEKIFSRFELFGLIVAAICHDINHDGFTNVYNEKAETPLGILFKNQSVMETHHCAVTIDIITKEETNLFEHLNPAEYKSMWGLLIQLVLVTDMAKHFSFLKEFNEKFDKGNFNLDTQENRITIMQLLLKCADISNVSRPFDLADKWVDVLCEEFFRQGDLEQANGMEYTSPLNDREHLDKPKSQIGFYTFVCLPLFQTMAKAIPKLDCNVQQILSNLAVWKAANEANNNNIPKL